ncbi:SCO-spondin [Nymphon striatum]|nr:SCO-spondin [Nymphon striatum]
MKSLTLYSFAAGKYGFKLSTVDTYISLTNDFVVHYKSKKAIDGLVLSIHRYEHNVYTKKISGKRSNGTIVVQCGVLYKPGNYTVAMFRQKSSAVNSTLQLLTSRQMIARLPYFEISGVPKLVQTYSFDLKILVTSAYRLCKPASFVEANGTMFELSVQSGTGTFDKKMFTHILPVWYNIRNFKVDIPCQSIDHPAKYKIEIRTSYLSENEVKSAILSEKFFRAAWNQKYSMEVPASLFPCRHHMKIYYSYPNICPKEHSDRIRLYGLLKPNVSSPEAPPAGIDYITEAGVDGGGVFSFPCDIIFSPSYRHFCIKYIVVSTYGSVYDAITECRPTYSSCKNGKCKFNSVIPEKWSDWSSWSACSTSCGELKRGATQVRHRMCLLPLYRGQSPHKSVKNCKGGRSEARQCQTVPPCPGICAKIAVDSIWMLRSTSEFHQVFLRFLHLDVTSDGVWIAVRDGDNSMSPLLTFGSMSNEISENVTSSARVLRIKFHLSKHDAADTANRTFGFIAVYEQKRTDGIISALPPPLKQSGVLSLTAFHLLIVSLVICWCFAVLVATFIFRKYRKGKLRRYASVHSCSSARSATSVIPVTPLTTPQRQKRLLRQGLKENPPSLMPEDYLADAADLLFSPLQKRRPVATIPPRPARTRFASTSTIGDDVVVLRKGMKFSKKAQRESQAPLTASVSELSVAGDDYEYDYYDIGGHYQMGSYFNSETGYGWDDPAYAVILSPNDEPAGPTDMVAMKELKPSVGDKS